MRYSGEVVTSFGASTLKTIGWLGWTRISSCGDYKKVNAGVFLYGLNRKFTSIRIPMLWYCLGKAEHAGT